MKVVRLENGDADAEFPTVEDLDTEFSDEFIMDMLAIYPDVVSITPDIFKFAFANSEWEFERFGYQNKKHLVNLVSWKAK